MWGQRVSLPSDPKGGDPAPHHAASTLTLGQLQGSRLGASTRSGTDHCRAHKAAAERGTARPGSSLSRLLCVLKSSRAGESRAPRRWRGGECAGRWPGSALGKYWLSQIFPVVWNFSFCWGKGRRTGSKGAGWHRSKSQPLCQRSNTRLCWETGVVPPPSLLPCTGGVQHGDLHLHSHHPQAASDFVPIPAPTGSQAACWGHSHGLTWPRHS